MSWRDKINIMNTKKGFFTSSNRYGIPDIKKDEFEVNELIPYRVDGNRNGTAHFFLDDYRFERCWNHPDKQLQELKKYDGVLSPDFALYKEYPLAMQLWQVYRNRWCAAFLQSKGIKVIPTIGWSTKESYKFAFLGVEKGSTVAIRTHCLIKNELTKKLFIKGFEEMKKRLEPENILIYGTELSELRKEANIRYFEPYNIKFNMSK